MNKDVLITIHSIQNCAGGRVLCFAQRKVKFRRCGIFNVVMRQKQLIKIHGAADFGCLAASAACCCRRA